MPAMKPAAAFRHLEQATDEGAMQMFFEQHLARLPADGGTLREVRVPRVFPRGNSGFVIQYELLFGQPDPAVVKKHILCGELQPRGSALPGYVRSHPEKVLVNSELGLLVPLFPFDPGLPALIEWAAADRAQDRLSDLLAPLRKPNGAGVRPAVKALSVLAYRLGRRCTIRYDFSTDAGDSGNGSSLSVIGRISRPGALSVRSPLPPWPAGGISPVPTWPDVLAVRDLEGIELLSCAPGRSVHDLIGDPSLEKACAAAGRVLACLHGAPPDGPPRRAGARADRLNEQVERAQKMFPSCASLFAEATEALKARPVKTGAPSLIHGDFYDKQVLYSEQFVTVVDFDTLAPGDPAMDVGNFNAHLSLRKMQHPASAAALGRGRAAFEHAYSQVSDEFDERCRVHESAALIRLAAMYSLRPRWRHLTIPLLEESRQCIALNL